MPNLLEVPVNVSYQPLIDERFVADDGADISIGDLHASADKFLFFLKIHKVVQQTFDRIDLQDHFDFQRIVTKHHSQVTQQDITRFDEIINNLQVDPEAADAVLRLLGDEVHDRRTCDYFVLRIKKKLVDSGIRLKTMMSNHGLAFIRAYETQDKFTPTDISAFNSNSIVALQDFIDRGLVKKEEIMSLIEKYYIPPLLMLDVIFDENGKPTYIMHAPFGLKTVRGLAKEFDVSFQDGTQTEIENMVNAINDKFTHYARNKIINTLFKLDDDGNLEQSAKFDAVWNRFIKPGPMYFMQTLPTPDELKNIRNSYILINRDLLIYIYDDASLEEVNLDNKDKFLIEIDARNPDNKNMIDLSDTEVSVYITSNGCHLQDGRLDCAEKANFMFAHDVKGLTSRKNQINLDNNLAKYSCYDNVGLYTIAYTHSPGKLRELQRLVKKLKPASWSFFKLLDVTDEKIDDLISVEQIYSFAQVRRLIDLLCKDPRNNAFYYILNENKHLIPLLQNAVSANYTIWDVITALKRNGSLNKQNLEVILQNNAHIEDFYYILLALEQTPKNSFNSQTMKKAIDLVLQHPGQFPAIFSAFVECRENGRLSSENIEYIIQLACNTPERIQILQLTNFLNIKNPEIIKTGILQKCSDEILISFKKILDFFHQQGFYDDYNRNIEYVIKFCLNNLDILDKIIQYLSSHGQYNMLPPEDLQFITINNQTLDNLMLITESFTQEHFKKQKLYFKIFTLNTKTFNTIFNNISEMRGEKLNSQKDSGMVITIFKIFELFQNHLQVFTEQSIIDICTLSFSNIEQMYSVLEDMRSKKLITPKEIETIKQLTCPSPGSSKYTLFAKLGYKNPLFLDSDDELIDSDDEEENQQFGLQPLGGKVIK